MSGGAHGEMEQVKLRCLVCDESVYIWRRKCKLKEKGHIKHLWCANCEMVTAHAEVREE